MTGAANRRRGVRIDAELAVRIFGVDTLAEVRSGNVSVSGLYVDVDAYPGTAGTVERLEVRSVDGRHRATLLAVVVRVLHVDDLWAGSKVRGVAFEFLFDDPIERAALVALVRHLAGTRMSGDGDLKGIAIDAQLDVDGAQGPARVAAMRSEAIVLETDWPVDRGARVHLVVDSLGGGAPIDVHGVVQHTVRESDARYRVEVTVGHDDDASTHGGDLEDAMSTLLAEVVVPESPSRIQNAAADLSGALDRVPLPSVLSFLEIERVRGALHLRQADVVTTVFLTDGRIVDVEGAADAADARARLRAALAHEGGTFRVDLGAAHGRTRFAFGAGALVLDLLRELDESRR